MNKKLATLFVMIGFCCLMLGGYQYIMESQAEREEPKIEETTKEELTNETKGEIVHYLSTKYEKDFEVVEKVQEYCFEKTNMSLVPSNSCSNVTIKDTIYKVKDNNGIEFVVKGVTYDKSKITLTEEEQRTQEEGYYDDYINVLKASEIEEELETLYTVLFNVVADVHIYDGLGIEDVTSKNAYQNLEKQENNIEISLDDFLNELSSPLEYEIKIYVKLDDIVTRDNFQQIVSKFTNSRLLTTTNNKITLNKILLGFKNDKRYIEYDRGFLNLKRGENVYDNSNEEVYDKTIILGNGTSTSGISYNEFEALDKLTFTFR